MFLDPNFQNLKNYAVFDASYIFHFLFQNGKSIYLSDIKKKWTGIAIIHLLMEKGYACPASP